VVIAQFNVERVTICEAKAHSPLVVDGHGVLPRPIARQRMKAVTRRNPEIVEPNREIHVLQFPHRALQDVWRIPL
jgi:hypothetical protein